MPFSSFYDLKKDVARFFLGNLKAGKEIKAIEDQMVTPTYVNDIADGLKTLILTFDYFRAKNYWLAIGLASLLKFLFLTL